MPISSTANAAICGVRVEKRPSRQPCSMIPRTRAAYWSRLATMATRLAASRLRTSVLHTVTSAGKRRKSRTSDSVARRSCSEMSATPASASSRAASARSIALSMIANRISCLDVTWLYRLGARTPRASAMSFIEVPR